MITNTFRFRIGVLLVLGLICTGAALGDGPLFPGAQYAAGNAPHSVAIGDLDGDQVPDLAVAHFVDWDGPVSVLLGLGDGTFAPAVHYPAGVHPHFVEIGDLNGDQVPDLVVANDDWDDSKVSVLLGLGDGTFAAAVDYAVGDWPESVAIGDLNGDQAPDLAVATAYSDYVSVLLGVGDGTLAAMVNYAVSDYPQCVAIGDLDGDQVPDLAVANWNSDNVSVLLGLGDGTFAWRVYYAAGDGPESVAIGDLDGDQVPDLAVANGVSDNVSVLRGLGDGTFAAPVHYAAGDSPRSVAIGDLDGDQVPDLAVANAFSDNVSVLLGLGDGTFAAPVHYAAGDEPRSVAIGDLDGDQVPDLAVANYGWPYSVSVLLGLGDGTFAAAVHYAAGDGPHSVSIGDLDGDQVPDLAVANWGPWPLGRDSTSVLLGVGDGTFAGAVQYEAGSSPSSVAIVDLDGDQMLDLAVANTNSHDVSVLLNQRDPTMPGDIDGDGDVDLADFFAFQTCYTGPGGGPVGPECGFADFDDDDDVDLTDFLAFQAAYTGPG